MIDERLKSANISVIRQVKTAKQAEDYLSGMPNREALEKTVAEWWKKFASGEFGLLDSSLPDPDAIYQEPLFIQTWKNSSYFFRDCTLSIRPELRESIIDLLQDPGTSDSMEKDAAGRLFGKVVALELAENEPDSDQLNLALSCFEVVTQFWPCFEETFKKTVYQRDKAREKWAALLSDVPKDISAYFSLRDPIGRSGIEFEQAEWQKTGNPFYVWDSQPAFYNDKLIPFIRLEILYWLDFKAWLNSLENLPLPCIKKLAVIYSHLDDDKQAILNLIRNSSLVFDKHGKWVNERKTAALYAILSAFRFSEKLFGVVSKNSPGSLQDLKERELPEWLADAFGTVLQRPDGKTISAAFIALLVSQHIGELIRDYERGQSTDWFLTECAINILAQKLAEKCDDALELMKKAWKFQQKSVGDNDRDNSEIKHLLEQGLPVLQCNSMQYYLSAVLINESLAMQYDSGDSRQSSQIRGLWNWFKELISGRDPFIDYICNPYSQGALNWITYNIGRILAGMHDPKGEFIEAYNLLQYQQKRISHQMQSNDITAYYPSHLLIRTGTGSILWTVDNPQKGMDLKSAKELWFILFDSSYQMWSLTHGTYANSSWRRLLEHCIAVASWLFKEDIEIPVRHVIEYFKTDSMMICSLAWLLWKNELPIESVLSLLYKSGVNIRDSLEEVELFGSGEVIMNLCEELTAVVNEKVEVYQ